LRDIVKSPRSRAATEKREKRPLATPLLATVASPIGAIRHRDTSGSTAGRVLRRTGPLAVCYTLDDDDDELPLDPYAKACPTTPFFALSAALEGDTTLA